LAARVCRFRSRDCPFDGRFALIPSFVSVGHFGGSDCLAGMIEDAFHEYATLVFPAQHLDAEQQASFGRRFGRLERGMGYLGHESSPGCAAG